MLSSVLASTDLADSPNWQTDFWLYIGIVLAGFSVFALVVTSMWLVRFFGRIKQISHNDISGTDDLMQQAADARAHLDASKRHIAALEEKLDQIQEQLKRRPLS